MTHRRHLLLATACLPVAAEAAPQAAPAWPTAAEISRREAEVAAVEHAFAACMAARDAAGFRQMLAADVVFVDGQRALRGPDAVMAVWQRYFDGPDAPFAWRPELVVVLPSGDLAQSSGPVTNAEGRVIAHFQSVWRRTAAGGWEIVLDQGSEVGR